MFKSLSSGNLFKKKKDTKPDMMVQVGANLSYGRLLEENQAIQEQELQLAAQKAEKEKGKFPPETNFGSFSRIER